MSTITYTAKDRGNLSGGRTAGTSYVFDIPVKTSDLSVSRKSKEAVSLSGYSETLLHRVESSKGIATAPINSDFVNDQIHEFIASVAAGESFLFDEKGTSSTPDNPVSATLSGDPSITRQGRSDIFTYSFKIKL